MHMCKLKFITFLVSNLRYFIQQTGRDYIPVLYVVISEKVNPPRYARIFDITDSEFINSQLTFLKY